MAFRAIESRVAGIRAPLRVKLQIGFLLVIGVLLVTGVVSLVAIAGIREQTLDLERMDASVHLALGLDHSIVLQEHLSSMFLLTAEDGYDTKLVAEQKRFRELLGQLGAKGATRPERGSRKRSAATSAPRIACASFGGLVRRQRPSRPTWRRSTRSPIKSRF